MGSTYIRPSVHAYLLDKVGHNVTTKDAAKALGIEPGQFAAALRALARREEVLFETIIRGQAWKIIEVKGADPAPVSGPPAPHPEASTAEAAEHAPEPEHVTYEYVGTASGGGALVRDDSGRVFKLVRV